MQTITTATTRCGVRGIGALLVLSFAASGLGACGPAESDHSGQGNSRVVLDAPVDATAIIDRLRETYWNCRTYRDQGTLTLTYGQPGKERSRQWTFSTAYRNPRLRFAFGQGPGIPVEAHVAPEWCAWSSSDGGFSLPDLPEQDGLAVRQFLSFDTLGTVPALLGADEAGPGWWGLCDSFQHVGYETIGGTPCLVVQTTARPPIHQVTLWIDRERYLLVRRAVDFEIGEGAVRGLEVSDYKPTLDAPVDDAEFKSGS
jgi:hypothetical protein